MTFIRLMAGTCTCFVILVLITMRIDPASAFRVIPKLGGLTRVQMSDDNVYLPWTLEDDKMLYELYLNRSSLSDICINLKRGEIGVKSRLKNIMNPNHKAFLRLFGGVEVSTKLAPFRPCKDVIERILWDPGLNSSEFSFAYTDRY